MEPNKTLSRDEAIKILHTQPNVHISHVYFDEHEYVYMKDGAVYTEEGYLFEDWYSAAHNGMRMRSGSGWETGWYIKRQNISLAK